MCHDLLDYGPHGVQAMLLQSQTEQQRPVKTHSISAVTFESHLKLQCHLKGYLIPSWHTNLAEGHHDLNFSQW